MENLVKLKFQLEKITESTRSVKKSDYEDTKEILRTKFEPLTSPNEIEAKKFICES